MKRVKIMLTAVTVLAVVGGALAFKAQKFTPSAVYCKPSSTCNFANFQRDLISGAVTTTQPCGTNIKYYSEPNCVTQITPTTTSTLYATNVE